MLTNKLKVQRGLGNHVIPHEKKYLLQTKDNSFSERGLFIKGNKVLKDMLNCMTRPLCINQYAHIYTERAKPKGDVGLQCKLLRIACGG